MCPCVKCSAVASEGPCMLTIGGGDCPVSTGFGCCIHHISVTFKLHVCTYCKQPHEVLQQKWHISVRYSNVANCIHILFSLWQFTSAGLTVASYSIWFEQSPFTQVHFWQCLALPMSTGKTCNDDNLILLVLISLWSADAIHWTRSHRKFYLNDSLTEMSVLQALDVFNNAALTSPGVTATRIWHSVDLC